MLIGVAVWTPRVFHKGLSGTVIPFTPTVDGGSGDTKTANGSKNRISKRIEYNWLTKVSFLCYNIKKIFSLPFLCLLSHIYCNPTHKNTILYHNTIDNMTKVVYNYRKPLKIPKLLQKRTKYDIMKAEEGKGSSSMKLISLFAEENRMQKLSALGDWGCRVKHFLCNMI